MKKTLLALMVLGCAAHGDDVTTVTLTSTNASSANEKSDAYGLVFDIDAGTGYRKEVSAQPTGYNYANESIFELQTITLSLAANSTLSDNVNVVLLNNLSAPADKAADKGDLMAFISHNSLTLSGGSMTMDFSDLSVKLEKGTQYRLYFTTSDYSESAIGTRITIGDDNKTTAPLLGYKVDNSGPARVHLGFLGSGLGPGLNQSYVPAMTMTLTPEPATATLSLLALAGLASRRRRH